MSEEVKTTIPEDRQVKTYPILYNPEIKALNDLKDIDWGLDQTLPSIDEILKASGIEEKQGDLVQSGILDDLNQAVNISNDDYMKVTYPKWTDDIVLNYMIEDDKKEYYKIRVKAQATQICDYIDALIRLDRYPKEMFGEYKKVYNFIRYTPDDFERVRALNQLRIIAKSIIPTKIKFEQVTTIEPSLVSATPSREG